MKKLLKIGVKYPAGSVHHPDLCYVFSNGDAEDKINEYNLIGGANFPDIQKLIELEDWRNAGCNKNPVLVEITISREGHETVKQYDFAREVIQIKEELEETVGV